ncbi:hypothetical protein [Sphingomonas sp. PAMC 26617]|nr:hypothetical protein [Sphingomonas sp. PAMC 26617]
MTSSVTVVLAEPSRLDFQVMSSLSYLTFGDKADAVALLVV